MLSLHLAMPKPATGMSNPRTGYQYVATPVAIGSVIVQGSPESPRVEWRTSSPGSGCCRGVDLTVLHGVGITTAATLLPAAGDNPERVASRAAFAALARVAPMRASSGHRHRHRLSRGGNRHANAAIHRIALIRLRH